MAVIRFLAVLLAVIGSISPGADGACDQASILKCNEMIPSNIPGARTVQDEYCGILACVVMDCMNDAIADCPSSVKRLLNPMIEATEKECPGYTCNQSLMRNSSSPLPVIPQVYADCNQAILKCQEKAPNTIPGAKTIQEEYCGILTCKTECMKDAIAGCPSTAKRLISPMLDAADNECPGYICNSSSLPQMASSTMVANLVLVVAYWGKLI